MLLARHRKSVFGKGFIGELGSENLATHRNSTLIEVLIATSLYYLRSYYPNLPHLSNDDIVANREVKKNTISLFNMTLFKQLINWVDGWVRVRPKFFDQVRHETMYASSGNKHFFTK